MRLLHTGMQAIVHTSKQSFEMFQGFKIIGGGLSIHKTKLKLYWQWRLKSYQTPKKKIDKLKLLNRKVVPVPYKRIIKSIMKAFLYIVDAQEF